MFERAGIGRTFALVNPAFGQTLGRLLTFLLAALVYSAIAGAIVSALVGPARGSWRTCCATSSSLPVTFASVGVAVVTYATLRNRENPASASPALAGPDRRAAAPRGQRARRQRAPVAVAGWSR